MYGYERIKMNKQNQTSVQFNKEQYTLWLELKDKKIIHKKFPEFVRDAYFNSIDVVKSKRFQ